MKKSLLFITLVGFGLFARGQSKTYRAFKVDITGGYAIPSSNTNTQTNVKAGPSLTIEPHFRLSDATAIGLRLEEHWHDDESESRAAGSICPTVEYYLGKEGFRPFIGAGLGFFGQTSFTIDFTQEGATLPSTSGFGAFPRLGFEFGHFRMSTEYNFAANNASYLAFHAGFFLGGGRKS